MNPLNTKITHFRQVTSRPCVGVVFRVSNMSYNKIPQVASAPEFIVRPDSMLNSNTDELIGPFKAGREIGFAQFEKKAPASLVADVRARLEHHFGANYFPTAVLFVC